MRIKNHLPLFLTLFFLGLSSHNPLWCAQTSGSLSIDSLSVLDTQPLAALAIAPDTGRIVYANPAAIRFYGYTSNDLLKMNIDQINMLGEAEIKQEMRKAQEEKRNFFIFPHRLASGEVRTVEVHASPVRISRNKTLLLSIIHDASGLKVAETEFLIYTQRIGELVEQRAALMAREEFNRRLLILSLITSAMLLLLSFILFFNIRKRRKAEASFSEKNRFLETLIDNLPGMVYRCKNDPEWTMEYIGGKCREMTGYTPDDFKDNRTLSFNDVIDPAYREKLWDSWQKKIREKTPLIEEYPILNKDGSLRWCWEHGRGIFDKKGNLLALEGFIADISQRKQTEEALRQSEEKIRTTLISIGDAVIVTDTEGKITLMNPVAEKLTGWNLAEAKDRPMEEVFHIINFHTRKICENPVRQVLESGKVVGLANHTALISRKGNEYQIADSGAPIFDDHRQITGVVVVFRDVTEEYTMREALENSEANYRMLTEQSFNMIALLDLSGNYLFCNPAYLDILGYTPQEMIGRNAFDIVHPEDRESALESFKKEVTHPTGQQLNYYRLICNNGNYKICDHRAKVLYNAQGKPDKLLLIAQDVSERMHAEEELKKSLQEKEILLKEIHHRVKNNLNIVVSLLSLQRGKEENEDVKNSLSVAQGRIYAMALIHEKLYQMESLSKILFPDYIQSLCTQIQRMYGNPATQVKFVYEMEKIPLDVRLAVPFGIIVNEILTNTYKHAFNDRKEGQVSIKLKKKTNSLILTIADDGPGLPEEVLEMKSDSTALKGKLGLELIRLLTEGQLHGQLRRFNRDGLVYEVVVPEEPDEK